jgi:hypothetical protein
MIGTYMSAILFAVPFVVALTFAVLTFRQEMR